MAVPATEFEVEYSVEVEARLAIDTIGGKLTELSERFGAMQASMMRWSLGMAIAVATLVYGIARFVK